MLYLFQQSIYGNIVCQYQRVKAPNDMPFAQFVDEPLKRIYTLLKSRYTLFQSLSFIVIQCILNIATDIPFFEIIKMIEQRTRIL